MKKILFLTLAALLCSGASARARKQAPKIVEPTIQPVPADSFSYAIGVQQAPSLKQYILQREGVEESQLEAFAEGLRAQLSEADIARQTAFVAGLKIAKMNDEQIIPSLNQNFAGKADTTYIQKNVYVQALVESLLGKATMADSIAESTVQRQQEYYLDQLRRTNLAWLEQNKKLPNVKTLPSGLQYEVLTKGDGPVPADTCEVEVHYEGKLIDGTVFDSSYQRGKTATFGVKQVIKGWTEALCMMPVGSTWNLYIPYNLAYGERGSRNIPPYATLVFKVELVGIKDKAAK
ncbi:MAG: FKBP-type peptidyl-prolyl cis-trans isomerase [Bacteroidaceae bacterium]|nr:FKBP-type peptidyl-prolyl cis-trans isomerase [Bacteroidaceae bacterium]